MAVSSYRRVSRFFNLIVTFNVSKFCYLFEGDIVVIHGQTLDQEFFRVVNLRTGQQGDVPCKDITLGI